MRPKVVRSVHYCEATNNMTEAAYHDATSVTGFPTTSIYPTKDAEGNPYTTEFGLCEYMVRAEQRSEEGGGEARRGEGSRGEERRGGEGSEEAGTHAPLWLLQ